MQNVDNNDVVEIDLMEIFGLMLHRLWLIILCAVAAGAVGFGVSKYVLTEQFQSTTRIYVLNKQNNDTLTYSDVQLGTQLTKDFREIIKSRYVLEQVMGVCGISGSSGELASRISVDTQSDTRIITITVTDTDPAMAQIIANALREAAAERIKYVMDIQAVNVVDEANFPTAPSAPSVKRWTAIGFLLGAFLCMAVILIRFLLDDTIKTSEDIERYLGLSTLGMIPIRDEKEGKEHGNGSRSRKQKHSREQRYNQDGIEYGQDDRKSTVKKRQSEEEIADLEVVDIRSDEGAYKGNSREDSYAEH